MHMSTFGFSGGQTTSSTDAWVIVDSTSGVSITFSAGTTRFTDSMKATFSSFPKKWVRYFKNKKKISTEIKKKN